MYIYIYIYVYICIYICVCVCVYVCVYPCVRLASSVGRASEQFDSHLTLTLYLESKNLSTTLNITYIT